MIGNEGANWKNNLQSSDMPGYKVPEFCEIRDSPNSIISGTCLCPYLTTLLFVGVRTKYEIISSE